MESYSSPQLTSQYYNSDEEYVRMYASTNAPTYMISNAAVRFDSKPPALPPKPPTTSFHDDQFATRSTWNNPAMSTTTQWNNNPTNTQWRNPTATNTQWTNPGSVQWDNNPAPINQSLEVQQSRRENLMLRNEIERLQQQNYGGGNNDAWLAQQNQHLHLRVAELTQENDELRNKLSSTQSELMVLQHSLKTHKEDFEQERRDRVRIHEEKEKLQQELESQMQIIKMLTEEHGGKLMEMENNLGLGNDEKQHCQRCNRLLHRNELFEHMQKCLQ